MDGKAHSEWTYPYGPSYNEIDSSIGRVRRITKWEEQAVNIQTRDITTFLLMENNVSKFSIGKPWVVFVEWFVKSLLGGSLATSKKSPQAKSKVVSPIIITSSCHEWFQWKAMSEKVDVGLIDSRGQNADPLKRPLFSLFIDILPSWRCRSLNKCHTVSWQMWKFYALATPGRQLPIESRYRCWKVRGEDIQPFFSRKEVDGGRSILFST